VYNEHTSNLWFGFFSCVSTLREISGANAQPVITQTDNLLLREKENHEKVRVGISKPRILPVPTLLQF
jgi:hypothetical protein